MDRSYMLKINKEKRAFWRTPVLVRNTVSLLFQYYALSSVSELV